tara:strand:+ start:98 stop:334 length:237 start_codon:yes stop_codon:yes gene_type:complete
MNPAAEGIKAAKHDEAIRRLADGYKEEFAEEVAADERFHDLLMDICAEFIDKEIPIVDEDTKWDLAMEMILRVTTRTV